MSNEEKARLMKIYGRVIAEIKYFPCGDFEITFNNGVKKVFSSVYELDRYMDRCEGIPQ